MLAVDFSKIGIASHFDTLALFFVKQFNLIHERIATKRTYYKGAKT